MATLNLKICMGTMCYVMGGAELRAVVESLPEEVRQHVEVSFSPCLGMCGKGGEPPYIELNGKLMPGISKANLIQILKEELNHVV